MENQYSYYSTFKFYDEKGRRLSCFAEDNGDGTMNIVCIPCSLDEEFSKKEGRRIYEEGDYVFCDLYTIDIVKGFPRKSFLDLCRKNYYKLTMGFIQIPVEIFSKGTNIPLSGIGGGEDYLGEKY